MWVVLIMKYNVPYYNKYYSRFLRKVDIGNIANCLMIVYLGLGNADARCTFCGLHFRVVLLVHGLWNMVYGSFFDVDCKEV